MKIKDISTTQYGRGKIPKTPPSRNVDTKHVDAFHEKIVKTVKGLEIDFICFEECEEIKSAQLDMLAIGTGMIEINDEGNVKRIPPSEWPDDKGGTTEKGCENNASR